MWIVLCPSHKASILLVLHLGNLDSSRFYYGRQMLGVFGQSPLGSLFLTFNGSTCDHLVLSEVVKNFCLV